MITEENLNKLYQEVIKGTKLTTKELNSYGFTGKDLKKLIEDGKLERIKIGLYRFIDSKVFYDLGKQAISEKNYEIGNSYFEKCYELDNTNEKALYSLFIKSVKDRKYDYTIKYYEKLITTANNHCKKDYNTYIYLLNIITKLPQNLQEYAKKLTLEDLSLLTTENRYKDIIAQNKIRKSIINKNLKFALKQLNDLTAKYKENTVYDVVLRTLIIDAIEKEKIYSEELLKLIKNKQYQESITILKEKEQSQNLSIIEQYIVKLSKTILYIKKNKEIPSKIIEETENIYNAIDGNNYSLALDLSISNSKKYNLDNNNNIMYLLLTEISNLIKELESNKSLEATKIEQKNKPSIGVTDIINNLIQNDIDASLVAIKEYLNIRNKKEYEFLITNLIKISLLEKDITYTKAILVLINLNKNNYQFDVSNYIEEFYLALSQNKFEEAKIYLDIISNSKKLGQECIFTENLQKVLNQAKITVEKKITSTQTEIKQEETIYEVIPKEEKEPKKVLNKQKETTPVVSDSEKEFIETKYQKLLLEKGAILLKPMNKERRNRIYEIIDNYPDVVAFSIGTGEIKNIVLRYKPYIEEYIDIKKLIIDGNKAYTDQNYDECINCYLQVLSFGKPKTMSYAKLGLSYMKKFNLEKAIEYLTIATQLSKEKNEAFDFTELIDSLRGNKSEEAKPRFAMQEQEFKNDLYDHYGIKNFEEINEFIVETKLDVDSACIKLNMNEEQRTRIKLLYAKLYYSQGEYDLGDLFLNAVEKNQNKSNFIKKQIEEVKRTKKFYTNRTDTSIKKLSLNLKPKK